tara:strand:+ start:173 stop:634 length:462 start_codon:yes stop_codon:yes gene_type:complete
MSWLDSSENSSNDKFKAIIKKYPDLNLSMSDAKVISKLQFISPDNKRIQPNLLWVSYDLKVMSNRGGMQDALMMEGFRVTSTQTVYTGSNVFGNVANTSTTFGGAQFITYQNGKSVYIHGDTNRELYLLVRSTKKPSKKIKRVILRKIKNGDY